MKREKNISNIRRIKKTQQTKIWINTIYFLSPLEFSKLCLIAEAKFIILSNVVLNVCRR
jgi:hypothetical protein